MLVNIYYINNMYIFIYYKYIHLFVYIYIYIERERERCIWYTKISESERDFLNEIWRCYSHLQEYGKDKKITCIEKRST